MTRDEFKILVKGMKAVYAQQTFLPDKDALRQLSISGFLVGRIIPASIFSFFFLLAEFVTP